MKCKEIMLLRGLKETGLHADTQTLILTPRLEMGFYVFCCAKVSGFGLRAEWVRDLGDEQSA